jgi:hypothetical protein
MYLELAELQASGSLEGLQMGFLNWIGEGRTTQASETSLDSRE